jgi:hypothetical protein
MSVGRLIITDYPATNSQSSFIENKVEVLRAVQLKLGAGAQKGHFFGNGLRGNNRR